MAGFTTRKSSNSTTASSRKPSSSQSPKTPTKNKQLATPPSTPTRELFARTVRVEVGTPPSTVLVHRDLFTAVSPFFRAAFDPQSGFSESTSETLRLPDIQLNDFNFFVQWVYRQNLGHEELERKCTAYFRLIRLYSLADRLGVEDLRNAVVDEMARLSEKYNSVPTPQDTRTIDDELRENCGLRELVVDLFVWKKTDNLVQMHEDSWYVHLGNSMLDEYKAD